MDNVISPTLLSQMRAAWEAVNNGWNQWVLNYTQQRQLDLLRSIGFESPSWQDLARLLGMIAGAAALAGIAWSLWDKAHQDPWQRLMNQVRLQLKKRIGLDLPAHMPPRGMAEQVRAHSGGTSGEPLAQWLLQLEKARYAQHPEAALPQLQRDLHRIAWPATQAT
ncbi:hypothetical protein SDC9_207482 [bioreactor metagenome]|uniref:DUF3488 domain-containing protein n=1 Tax=bioreactor metagenome TaxID=1076179 RepID=A0A645J9E1_9ZZZZ